ncbi:MAG: hypothetical protein ACREH6_02825, partial [Geminicoccaceae bacterium]
ADLQRVEGELRLLAPRPDFDAAVSCFERSMATARAKDARLPELRAAVALCRVWREQGRHADAYGLLAPLYGWFTEGFATPDLMSAKALLDELAG